MVDTVDKCDQDTRWALVEAYESITESSSLVKVFFSSREEGDLRLSLQAHSVLQKSSLENEDDIWKSVEIETETMVAKKQSKQQLTELIKKDVISSANGMRWRFVGRSCSCKAPKGHSSRKGHLI